MSSPHLGTDSLTLESPRNQSKTADAVAFRRKFAYYDANIWIAHMLGSADLFYCVCKPLIDDIENGRKIVLVTHLVIMETIYALRRRLVEKNISGTNDTDVLTTEVEEYVVKFIRLVARLSEQEKIIIPRPSSSISDLSSVVANTLRRYFGQISRERHCTRCQRKYPIKDLSSECPSCNGPLEPSRKYKYKGLSHVDIEHAYFARSFNASTFYTTDASFNDLSRDADFSLITFEILNTDS